MDHNQFTELGMIFEYYESIEYGWRMIKSNKARKVL